MAAENLPHESHDGVRAVASMRPRRMAAENTRVERWPTGRGTGFNEAAAHGRGKPRAGSGKRTGACRFNEAAAHGRGKRKESQRRPEQRCRLQ